MRIDPDHEDQGSCAPFDSYNHPSSALLEIGMASNSLFRSSQLQLPPIKMLKDIEQGCDPRLDPIRTVIMSMAVAKAHFAKPNV